MRVSILTKLLSGVGEVVSLLLAIGLGMKLLIGLLVAVAVAVAPTVTIVLARGITRAVRNQGPTRESLRALTNFPAGPKNQEEFLPGKDVAGNGVLVCADPR